MDDFLETNRAHWNELAAVHPTTDHYDVASVLAGGSSLNAVERAELPDLEGRSVLHLQCHFGLDTLSLARMGAKEIVGVDFSDRAIDSARDLNDRAGLGDRTEFVCADVYDVPDVLERTFDLVFTSYGVIYWLPELGPWAEVIADSLRPDGTFYIVEIHPFTSCLESVDGRTAEFAYPYFGGDALRVDDRGSYADREAELEHRVRFEWAHSMGEIVTALTNAGLAIEFLHEHAHTTFPQFESMIEVEDGRWELEEVDHDLPLLFSLRAKAE